MRHKKQKHESGPAGASQRELRVGGLVRQASVVLVSALVSSPAYAEVCDKAVGESWLPSHGPVWLLNPVGFPVGLTTLVCGLLIVALFRLRWLGYLVAAFLVIFAFAAIVIDMIPEHDMYLAQVREGCRSVRTDWMNVGLVSAFAVAYVWLGRRTHVSKLQEVG